MTGSLRPETFRSLLPYLDDAVVGIHPERWDSAGLSGEARERLLGCPRSRLRLSRCLDWLLPDEVTSSDWNAWPACLGSPSGRWAGLPGDELWGIGLRFGAGSHRVEVAGLLRRADVVAFRERVGVDAHSFALRQAPLLWRDGASPLPGVSGSDAGDLAERVISTAGKALGCWLKDLPPGLGVRVKAKLPPRSDSGIRDVSSWPPEQLSAWASIMNRVFMVSSTLPA